MTDPAPLREAIVRDEASVAFRDIFLSWHTECGTVETCGPASKPISKFQARWPELHKRLWSASMRSDSALRDEWTKIAEECEK